MEKKLTLDLNTLRCGCNWPPKPSLVVLTHLVVFFVSNDMSFLGVLASGGWMEDPQEDPLAVHCFCMCRGNAFLGDLGVSRSRERDLSDLSIYPRIFLRVFIVYRLLLWIFITLLYSTTCSCVLVVLV